MESCPTQAVLPLVGLAADKVIRDRYIKSWRIRPPYAARWYRLSLLSANVLAPLSPLSPGARRP
ncbi:MAG: hypothetical protein R6U98_14400 [Pirellulaceae bacterium]